MLLEKEFQEPFQMDPVPPIQFNFALKEVIFIWQGNIVLHRCQCLRWGLSVSKWNHSLGREEVFRYVSISILSHFQSWSYFLGTTFLTSPSNNQALKILPEHARCSNNDVCSDGLSISVRKFDTNMKTKCKCRNLIQIQNQKLNTNTQKNTNARTRYKWI